MMRGCAIVLFCLIPFSMSMAQQTDGTSKDSATARISIASIPSGSQVLVDSLDYGSTPTNVSVAPGRHIVRVAFPSWSAWQAQVRIDTVSVAAGGEVSREYRFTPTVSLLSIPSGAEVELGGRSVGTTPLSIAMSEANKNVAVLKKSGFDSVSAQLASAARSSLTVRLRSQNASNGTQSDLAATEIKPPITEQWATLGAGGTMLVSGVVAAILKDKANKEFSLYNQTLDGTYLDTTRRLDRQSSIAFAITQISFALFTYLLLAE